MPVGLLPSYGKAIVTDIFRLLAGVHPFERQFVVALAEDTRRELQRYGSISIQLLFMKVIAGQDFVAAL